MFQLCGERGPAWPEINRNSSEIVFIMQNQMQYITFKRNRILILCILLRRYISRKDRVYMYVRRNARARARARVCVCVCVCVDVSFYTAKTKINC